MQPRKLPSDILGLAQDAMFVVTGKVETLYITNGSINLLKGMQGKMLAAGMGGVIEGMAGSVTNSAMFAMYDGESVQHFGCYIDGIMVIGTFEQVGFAEGDDVEMVVTRLDDKGLFAHAVIRRSDSLLWMPFSVSKGRMGIVRWLFNLMFGIQFVGLLFILCLQFFMGGFHNRPIELILFIVPIQAIVAGALGFGVYLSSTGDGIYAENIFRVLGFKSPWRVNISPYSQARLGTGGSYQVYNLYKALKAYDSIG
jgi:hypothetical protein